MSKEYYKKRLVDLKLQIQREQDAKKRDNEKNAKAIKAYAKNPSTKAYYQKRKIQEAESHDKKILALKKTVEQTKVLLSKEKS